MPFRFLTFMCLVKESAQKRQEETKHDMRAKTAAVAAFTGPAKG